MAWFFPASSHKSYHPVPTDESLLPGAGARSQFEYESIFTFEVGRY